MTQAEDFTYQELKKKERAIAHIEDDLVFIEKWLAEDPSDKMEGYLKGRKSGLREVLEILK